MLFGSRAILGIIWFTERRGKCFLSSCEEHSIHFTFSAFVRRTMGKSSSRRLQWQSTLKPSDQSHRQHSCAAWVMVSCSCKQKRSGREYKRERVFCMTQSLVLFLSGLQFFVPFNWFALLLLESAFPLFCSAAWVNQASLFHSLNSVYRTGLAHSDSKISVGFTVRDEVDVQEVSLKEWFCVLLAGLLLSEIA